MNEHQLVTTYKTEGGSLQIAAIDIPADLSHNIEREGLIAGSTSNRFTISLPVAKLKGFAMGIKKSAQQAANKNAEATIKTNSTSSPTNTFTGVVPGKGIYWIIGSSFANPITGDVTDIYVDVTGDANVDFILRAAVDSTPELEG